MATSRRHPPRKSEAGAAQLTLADWERERARDSEQPKQATALQPKSTHRDIAPLGTALAPRIAAVPATRAIGAVSGVAGTACLLTLDQLVAELPPAKRPETWKRWLYERTRRGEIPGCVKLGGMLFFQREAAVAWLRAGMTATK
jgi:hypothetical protein